MARPCRSVELTSKHLTKEEIRVRKENEQKLRGGADKIKPPSYLNSKQRKIFKYIVEELKASEILSNLDIYILVTCSIAIDRLQEIEKIINSDIEKLADKSLMSAKDKYTKDLFRCCNELSLSPQSRAKLGNINVQASKDIEDPLLKVLRGGS